MNSSYEFHKLKESYVLWNHDINDKDWSLESYKNLLEINTAEDYWYCVDNIPDKVINYSMLFLMKKGIMPTWEDPQNIGGGCISIKMPIKEALTFWKIATKYLVSENVPDNINGISISSKKTFNIVKLWINEKIEDITNYKLPDEFNLNGKILLFRVHKINIEKDKNKV